MLATRIHLSNVRRFINAVEHGRYDRAAMKLNDSVMDGKNDRQVLECIVGCRDGRAGK